MKHKKYLRKQVDGEEGEDGVEEGQEEEEGEREARVQYIKKETGEEAREANNNQREDFTKGGDKCNDSTAVFLCVFFKLKEMVLKNTFLGSTVSRGYKVNFQEKTTL